MSAIISVENLSKHYKRIQKKEGILGSVKNLFAPGVETVTALQEISFEIQEGEFVGLLGPNGAGKTTMIKLLSGLIYPSDGEIMVLGYKPWTKTYEYQLKFSLVMGNKNQLWWDLPAIESFHLAKEIYGLNKSEYKRNLGELVDMLEVEPYLNVQVRRLSLGERMRMELINALLHKPRILYLDEPTLGLDFVAQKNIRSFLKEYNHRYESTIILTSHYMKDIEELCERLLIINRSRLVYDGKLSELDKVQGNRKAIVLRFSHPVNLNYIESISDEIKVKNDELEVSLVMDLDKFKQDLLPKLSTYPIEDIKIDDIPVEEIIQNIYQSEKQKNVYVV